MPLYTFLHNLLNVLVQIANKVGLQQKLMRAYTGGEGDSRYLSLYTCVWEVKGKVDVKRGNGGIPPRIIIRKEMEVSGQLNASASVPQFEEPLVPIG
jgi:hypothetical protein